MNTSSRVAGLAVLACLTAGLALAAPPPTADLLIVNARVFTGVATQPWAEALAIKGDRIVAVGTTVEVLGHAGSPGRRIDAGGRLLIPGINDAHTHPTAAPPHTALEGPPAFEREPTLDEVIARVQAGAARAPAGGWLVGEIGGRVLEDPKATREVLDAISGGRPVMLQAWHGHGVLLNTEAMRRLEVGEQEPDPPGGFFVRVPDRRRLTGLAHEYADFMVLQRFAMLADRAAHLREYQRFGAEAASLGITSVQAMMTGYPAGPAAAMLAEATLPIRVRVIDFPMSSWSPGQTRDPLPPAGLVVRSGAKWILDGTPIERLMFLREPYNDAPGVKGRLNFSEAEVRQVLTRALAAGEQPMFHATGDATIDLLLAALEATGGDKWAPLRPRIEHGDMLEPAHFERAKRLGVVVVQNPSHFMIAPIMQARLGSRTARTELVKSIVVAGVPFAIGSDGPLNPFLNMMFGAINATNPAEALTIEQALVAYTRGAAAAERMDTQKGTLAPGMLADLAMLSQDIFNVAPPELPKTTSVLTVVGGKVVHEALPQR